MKGDLYARLYLWLSERRRVVLVVTLLVAVASALISLRIDLEEDILDTLPQRDPLVDDYRYALRKFSQIDRVYIDVSGEDAEFDTIRQAADEMHAGLAENTAFKRIMYRFELGGQEKVVDFLTGALPNLFTDEDATALAPKLREENIREYLTVMRRKLAGPEGMVLKNVVAADPIGMSELLLNKVMPLQTGFGDAQMLDGRIVSGDGRHILMMAEPRFSSSNSGENRALVDDMVRLADEIEGRFPGIEVAITGGHRMTVDNARLIIGDTTRCIFLGMTAMLVLCLTSYRRRWLATLTFLPSLFGTLIAGVVIALWDHHLSAIATGFATIAIGITVDYAMHVVYHLDDAAGADRRTIGHHLSRLVAPIGIGALTSIAAFVVMMGSKMHGYQQLGMFGAVGVLFSALFALVILPLLVPVPKKADQSPLWLTSVLEKYFAWQSANRIWLVGFAVLLTIATGFGISKLRFEGDIAQLNGITESTRHDEEIIRETWGDTLGMTLVVARGATLEEALEQNDRAARLLADRPGVSGVYSLAAVSPSRATQTANIERWRAFWSPDVIADVRATLDRVGAELGFRQGAFSAFWNRVESDPEFLTLENLEGTPLEQMLTERVALAEGDNAISTLFKLDDRSDAARLRVELPEMIVLDHRAFADHIADLAKDGLGDFAIWTLIAVVAILFLTLGSIELVAVALIPLAIGLAWTFGMMGWLGLPINIMNSVFVVFVIGIGEDYSVFLLMTKLNAWRGRPQKVAVTSASVLISALTTIFGFGVLVFANHPVLFSMGTTVLIGMIFTLAATIFFTPLFMDILLFKDQPRGAPRWWHLIGTVWFSAMVAVSQVFLYYVLRPVVKLASPGSADDRLRRATRSAARWIIRLMPFGRVLRRDIDSRTFEKPAVVISNHQSAADVFLMVGLPGDIRQTAKKRVFDTPILGIGCKILGHVMVEPRDPAKTLERCRQRLEEGALVHFYPEGTRSVDGFVGRFHLGAFDLAIERRCDVLPVVFCDTNTAMPRDAFWFEPYRASIRALPRITPESFDYNRGGRELMQHCESVVKAAHREQLDALNTPDVVRRKVARLYRYQGKFVEQFVYWKMRMDPVFLALDRIVPREAKVLDLGCGYGLMSHWLSCFTDQRRFCGIDYDEDKIRVARRTATDHPRIFFEHGDILEAPLPECDVVLLIDVLHYWEPAKQQAILAKVHAALRPGGVLVFREAAGGAGSGQERVAWWEKLATRLGHNQTKEGLHFQTRESYEAALKKAGFNGWEEISGGGRDSNFLLVARR